MKEINTEKAIWFDVDNTLVMWGEEDNPDAIEITDVDGSVVRVVPNEGHIRLLKRSHARGSTVIVWSDGGFKWCRAVVEALGIVDSVDYVMTKPFVYVDDSKWCDWSLVHIYLKDGYGHKIKIAD